MKTTFEALPLKAVFEYEGCACLLVKVSENEYYHSVAENVYPKMKRHSNVIHRVGMDAAKVIEIRQKPNTRLFSELERGSYFGLNGIDYKFKKVDEMRALCVNNFEMTPFDCFDMVILVGCSQELKAEPIQQATC